MDQVTTNFLNFENEEFANTVLFRYKFFPVQIHVRVCRISRNIVFESTTRRQRRGLVKEALGRSRRVEDKHVSTSRYLPLHVESARANIFAGFFFFATSLTESRLGPVTYCKTERRVNPLHVPPPSA